MEVDSQLFISARTSVDRGLNILNSSQSAVNSVLSCPDGYPYGGEVNAICSTIIDVYNSTLEIFERINTTYDALISLGNISATDVAISNPIHIDTIGEAFTKWFSKAISSFADKLKKKARGILLDIDDYVDALRHGDQDTRTATILDSILTLGKGMMEGTEGIIDSGVDMVIQMFDVTIKGPAKQVFTNQLKSVFAFLDSSSKNRFQKTPSKEQYKEAYDKYDKINDAAGIIEGFSWSSTVSDLINGTSISDTQNFGEYINKNSKMGDNIGDAVYNLGRQLPTIAIGEAVGYEGIPQQLTTFVSVYAETKGTTFEQEIAKGASVEDARRISRVNAGFEAGIEAFSGGVGGVDSPTVRAAVAGEIGEEILGYMVEPFKDTASVKDATVEDLVNNVLEHYSDPEKFGGDLGEIVASTTFSTLVTNAATRGPKVAVEAYNNVNKAAVKETMKGNRGSVDFSAPLNEKSAPTTKTVTNNDVNTKNNSSVTNSSKNNTTPTTKTVTNKEVNAGNDSFVINPTKNNTKTRQNLDQARAGDNFGSGINVQKTTVDTKSNVTPEYVESQTNNQKRAAVQKTDAVDNINKSNYQLESVVDEAKYHGRTGNTQALANDISQAARLVREITAQADTIVSAAETQQKSNAEMTKALNDYINNEQTSDSNNSDLESEFTRFKNTMLGNDYSLVKTSLNNTAELVEEIGKAARGALSTDVNDELYGLSRAFGVLTPVMGTIATSIKAIDSQTVPIANKINQVLDIVNEQVSRTPQVDNLDASFLDDKSSSSVAQKYDFASDFKDSPTTNNKTLDASFLDDTRAKMRADFASAFRDAPATNNKTLDASFLDDKSSSSVAQKYDFASAFRDGPAPTKAPTVTNKEVNIGNDSFVINKTNNEVKTRINLDQARAGDNFGSGLNVQKTSVDTNSNVTPEYVESQTNNQKRATVQKADAVDKIGKLNYQLQSLLDDAIYHGRSGNYRGLANNISDAARIIRDVTAQADAIVSANETQQRSNADMIKALNDYINNEQTTNSKNEDLEFEFSRFKNMVLSNDYNLVKTSLNNTAELVEEIGKAARGVLSTEVNDELFGLSRAFGVLTPVMGAISTSIKAIDSQTAPIVSKINQVLDIVNEQASKTSKVNELDASFLNDKSSSSVAQKYDFASDFKDSPTTNNKTLDASFLDDKSSSSVAQKYDFASAFRDAPATNNKTLDASFLDDRPAISRLSQLKEAFFPSNNGGFVNLDGFRKTNVDNRTTTVIDDVTKNFIDRYINDPEITMPGGIPFGLPAYIDELNWNPYAKAPKTIPAEVAAYVRTATNADVKVQTMEYLAKHGLSLTEAINQINKLKDNKFILRKDSFANSSEFLKGVISLAKANNQQIYLEATVLSDISLDVLNEIINNDIESLVHTQNSSGVIRSFRGFLNDQIIMGLDNSAGNEYLSAIKTSLLNKLNNTFDQASFVDSLSGGEIGLIIGSINPNVINELLSKEDNKKYIGLLNSGLISAEYLVNNSDVFDLSAILENDDISLRPVAEVFEKASQNDKVKMLSQPILLTWLLQCSYLDETFNIDERLFDGVDETHFTFNRYYKSDTIHDYLNNANQKVPSLFATIMDKLAINDMANLIENVTAEDFEEFLVPFLQNKSDAYLEKMLSGNLDVLNTVKVVDRLSNRFTDRGNIDVFANNYKTIISAVRDRFVDVFGDLLSTERIEKIGDFNNTLFYFDEGWNRVGHSDWLGFHSPGGRNFIHIDPINIFNTVTTFEHEEIHDITDEIINGVHVDGFEMNDQFAGLNESATEFVRQVFFPDNRATQGSGYQPGVDVLKVMLEHNLFDANDFKKAIVNHDITLFTNIFGYGEAFKTFVDNMEAMNSYKGATYEQQMEAKNNMIKMILDYQLGQLSTSYELNDTGLVKALKVALETKIARDGGLNAIDSMTYSNVLDFLNGKIKSIDMSIVNQDIISDFSIKPGPTNGTSLKNHAAKIFDKVIETSIDKGIIDYSKSASFYYGPKLVELFNNATMEDKLKILSNPLAIKNLLRDGALSGDGLSELANIIPSLDKYYLKKNISNLSYDDIKILANVVTLNGAMVFKNMSNEALASYLEETKVIPEKVIDLIKGRGEKTFDYLNNNLEKNTKFRLGETFGFTINADDQKFMNLDGFAEDELVPMLEEFYKGIISPEDISALADNKVHNFISNERFKQIKGKKTKSAGFNARNGNFYNLAYGEELIKHMMVHESMHLLARDGSKSGFEVAKNYKGLNESATEFLALVAEGIGIQNSSYQTGAYIVSVMINNDIFTLDELKRAYINNDLSIFTNVFGNGDAYNSFVNDFNEMLYSRSANNRDAAQIRLEKLINKYLLGELDTTIDTLN